jgi:carbamoyl-phosphate synthase large subunit
MQILLSSVGRRGYLVKYFREALGAGGQLWGGDSDRYAPAFRYCDRCVVLPEVTDPVYHKELLRFCKNNEINMVVPLIDPELEVLSLHREQFEDAGIMVVVSPRRTIEVTADKCLTYEVAKKNGIAVPKTVTTINEAKKLLAAGEFHWPVMVKPRKGSASTNITYCRNEKQLESAFESCPMPMIQEQVEGQEYGYDLFGDRQCRPISVFCKLKLAMRAGETDKAISTNNEDLIALGARLAEVFKIFGPADVDVIAGGDGPKLLEINPRFGGGYPCAHLCGANFPAKLISMFRRETLTPDIGSYPAGVCMLKQDEIISPDNVEGIKPIRDWLGEGSDRKA